MAVMKILKISLTAALMIFAASAFASPVQVHIHGLKKNTGSIILNLFAKPTSWDHETPDAVVQITPLQGDTAITTMDLPPGEYAFFLYHDEDGSGDLKRGTFGLPGEPYAFSNNVRIGFSKPSFAKMKFAVSTSGATQEIQLIQP
jgi:uncharacterized protein (DUF2141 family)